MSDEKIVHVTPDANPTQPNKDKQSRQCNPVGKIARLPFKIREKLNRRIRNNERSRDVLPWLNELPAVKKILAVQFDGKPINSQNFSKWRQGGYKLWLQRQEEVDEIQWLAEDAKDFARAADGNLARGAASVATAKILKMLHEIPPGQGSINDLTKISFAISALLNADQNQVRLEHDETRVFQGNERLVLSWDKFLRGCIDTVQRALTDEIARDIQAADIDNGEKIELLGHRMFGRKWQGRVVGKREVVVKKEPEGSKKESPKNAEEEKMDAQERHEPKAGSPPHPQSLSPDGGERNSDISLSREPVVDKNVEPEKAQAQTADQQVRPTEAKDNMTEPDKKGLEVKALPSVPESQGKQSGCRDTARPHPGLLPQEKGNSRPSPSDGTQVKASGGEKAMGLKASGGLPTAATISDPKLKAPAVELSPYDKAIREGKTHVEALYAQYSRINNAQPKPQEDPSQPKPNPLDTFSEPVKKSPFALLSGLRLRPSSLG